MKSRTIAVALMFFSLLVVAASAQVNNANTFPRPIGELVLQDDDSGDSLLIDLPSGGYKFKSCRSDFVLGGIAQVGFLGCSVSLKEVSESRLVLIEADPCSGQGRAYIEVLIGGPYSSRVCLLSPTQTQRTARRSARLKGNENSIKVAAEPRREQARNGSLPGSSSGPFLIRPSD